MRFVTIVLLMTLLAACGSRTGGPADVAADAGPNRGVSDGGSVPSGIPAARGDVATRGVATVLDDGEGAELCLGGVEESWPPQCSGPPLVGWDWKQQRMVPGQSGGPVGGAGYEQGSGVRWGRYALTGQWDGTSFTVATAVPEALHESTPPEPPTPPKPEEPVGPAALKRIARELMDLVPGALSSYGTDDRAHVDVFYDDGSLQGWVDGRYGAGVVVVTSALLDVPD